VNRRVEVCADDARALHAYLGEVILGLDGGQP
jgi:hypothetical protein